MGMDLFKKSADGVPYLSPSQINLLMLCPAKWRYKYVDQMKDTYGLQARIGNFVHEALETATLAKMEGRDFTPGDVDQMAFESALHWLSDPEQVKILPENEQADAMDNSDKYARLSGSLAATGWSWLLDSGLKPVSAERGVERLVKYKGNELMVGGRLDLLAEDPDGKLVVIDWKTCSRAPSRNHRGEYVMDRAHALQQLIYARGLRDEGLEVSRVATLKITKTKTPKAYLSYVDVTPGMLAWAQSIVNAAIQLVYTDTLPPNPIGAGFLCQEKYCFAYQICPGSPQGEL